MNFVSTSLRFAEWALEAVVIPPVLIVFVLALGSLSLAAIRQKPFRRGLWKPYYWLVLTHLLFFPGVIAVGVIWVNPITNPTVPHHARSREMVAGLADVCLICVLHLVVLADERLSMVRREPHAVG